MEYDWYADLFFLEEVYRDVLILWLAAVLMRRRAEVLRLLGAGIAGGLCSTGSVYLELMGRCPAGGQPSKFIEDTAGVLPYLIPLPLCCGIPS